MNHDFKSKFNLPKDGFLEPIDLIDIKIGFSVYKERQVGFKSLFTLYIKDEEVLNNNEIKPICINVVYGKETAGGITISSTDFRPERNWPINLNSENEYFYNVRTFELFDKNNKPKNGLEILKQIDDLHLSSTKIILRIPIRLKLLFQTILAKFIYFIFIFFAGIQYLISNQKTHIDGKIKISANQSKQNFDFLVQDIKGKNIKIFEYEVEARVAAMYCSLHLIIFLILYQLEYKPQFLITIFTNSFLTTMYGIVTLGLANALLPKILNFDRILYPILILIQKFYFKIISLKIKVNVPAYPPLIILFITSIISSRLFYTFIDDPEGPNLLIVVLLALVIYAISYSVYRLRIISSLFNLTLAIITQFISIIILYILLN